MPEGITPKKPCRRCLLAQVPDGAELARVIRERIELMTPDERAPEALWLERLACCQACDALNSGTCGLCGCYAELRAAKKRMHCPAVPAKW